MNHQIAQVAQLAQLLMSGAVPPNPAMLANLRANGLQQQAQRMGLNPMAAGGVPFSPNIPPPNMQGRMPGPGPMGAPREMRFNEAGGSHRCSLDTVCLEFYPDEYFLVINFQSYV